MKNSLSLTLVLSLVLAVGLACEFTTANLSEVTFAKDQEGTEKITSVNAGDKLYALSALNNTSSKHKVKWEVFQPDGEKIDIANTEIEVDGARPIWFTLTIPPSVPDGQYRFEITLLGATDGKQIDKKSGTISVKGGG